MNKTSIIQELAVNKTIEEIVSNIIKQPVTDDEEDLIQDLYLYLMEKDDKLIEDLYNKNQLVFYITRMVINNIKSTTSPYYYKYRRWTNNKVHNYNEFKEIKEHTDYQRD